MRSQKSAPRCLLVFLALLIPSVAAAQIAIAGSVTDGTGAALPGVTVEARSPALIEQVKSTVTDNEGRYRVVDLRPGTYSLSFSLPGFTTQVREGLILESNFTASLNIEMRVGAVAETVTVKGESPVVDVQTTMRREVVTTETLDAVPTGRNLSTVGATLPGLAQGPGTAGLHDVGGLSSMQASNVSLAAHGSRDAMSKIDGLPINTPIGEYGGQGFYLDMGSYQEMVFQVSGGPAESQTGGVIVNLIPKSGGNTFAGRIFGVWANHSLYSNNLSADQLSQLSGATVPPTLVHLFDVNGDLGGPIVKNRLWFYVSTRYWGVNQDANMVYNQSEAHLGTPGQPVVDYNLLKGITGRATYQLNDKNRFAVYGFNIPRTVQYQNILTLTVRPEAANYFTTDDHVGNVKWTAPLSTKFLAEAGYSHALQELHFAPQPGTKTPAEAPPYGDVQHCDVVLNVCSVAVSLNLMDTPLFRDAATASMTYVAGPHAFKAGFEYSHSWQVADRTAFADGVQLYQNGVPFAFNVFNTPIFGARQDGNETGLYVQDTWKYKRVTINPGLRWDYFVGSIPAQSFPAGRFVPARTFAAIDNVPNVKDFSPRLGGAIDLFGNGRTALKASIGKYVLAHTAGGLPTTFNPAGVTTIGTITDQRNWSDLNGDGIAENNEIGPSRNPVFGIQGQPLTLAPGFTREWERVDQLAIDHEVRPGLGISVTYTRRDAFDPKWTQNVNQAPSSYQMLTVPDPRGNGQMLPVWQIIPGMVNAPNNVIENTTMNTRWDDAVDAIVNARLPGGVRLTAGTSTSRLAMSTCQVQDPNTVRFCDQTGVPFRTMVKVSGVYPLPWHAFSVGAAFQSTPGDERILNYVVTRTQLPQLSTASSVTVRLSEPGSLYFPYINQLDLSLKGALRVGKMVRLKPQIEIFNVFNVAPELTEIGTYPYLNNPLRYLNGRLIRLGFQLDY